MLFSMGVLSAAASAQPEIWSPRVSATTAAATLVHFNAFTPATQASNGTITVPTGTFVSGLEFTPDGRLWATVQGSPGSMLQGLYSVNRDTGAAVQVGAPVGLAANETITDLAWNPVTHRLTGMATPSSGGVTSRLLNFDINTGAVASARTMNSTVSVLHVALTCQPDGQYLFVDIFNSWVSHNVDDNVIWLGNLLPFDANYNQGFGTEQTGPNAGRVWYAAWKVINAAQGTGQPALYTVNPANGLVTLIGNLPGGSTTIYTDAAVEPDAIHCAADLVHNNIVDDSDFVEFASQYDAFECGAPAMTGGCSADFNFDGVVDDSDFVTFALAYDALVCS